MNELKTGRNRRSIWNAFVIEESFKQRQIIRLLTLTALNVGVSTAAFILLYNHEISVLRSAGFPLYDVETPGNLRIIIVWVALMSATGGLFALLTGLLMTHRMAGPIHKFKQELGQIEAGQPPREIVLRKGDDFVDVAEALNRALQTLWSRSGDVAGADELALDRIRAVHTEILDGLENVDVSTLADADQPRVLAWRDQMRALRTKLDS